ncbi:MAG TPA: hypothetical protein VIY54_05770 [Steroidobacteraceae bacterium]
MSNAGRKWAMRALLLASAAAVGACVSGPGYVGPADADVGYGVDYYEPYGYEYGGWGPGYWIGPPGRYHDHDRGDHGDHDRGHQGRPAPRYRPAHGGRAAPSIPQGGRHAGGGHPPH